MKQIITPLLAFLLAITVQAQVPSITRLSTYAATAGTEITIQGLNFAAERSANIVYFGGVKANVLAATTQQLRVVVPTGATFRPVTVTTNGLTAYSARSFAVISKVNEALSANTFVPRLSITVVYGAAGLNLADYDGDRKPDYSMTNSGTGRLSVLRNVSSPGTILSSSLAEGVTFPASGPVASEYADMDGDGDLDLLVVNPYGSFAIYKNTASPGNISIGSFPVSPVYFSAPQDANGIGVGDFDLDGKPDVVITSLSSRQVSVKRNNTTGGVFSFDQTVSYNMPGSAWSVTVADIDRDGKSDLVVPCSSANVVAVLKNASNSTISFLNPVTFTSGSAPRFAAVGDLDGDDKPDIAVGNRSQHSVSLFRNIGIQGFITSTTFAARSDISCATPLGVALGEFDGDDKLDLAVASNVIDGKVTVFKNNSMSGLLAAAAFHNKVEYRTVESPVSVVIGDLDGDGRADLSVVGINQLGVFQNVSAQPTESVVTSPAHGAVSVDPRIEIEVSPVEGAGLYTVQLSTVEDFSLVEFEERAATPEISIDGLAPGTPYYARVFTNLATDPGPVSSFTTAVAGAYITSPADGEAGVSITTILRANFVPGASSYTIQLSASDDFASIAFEGTSSERTLRVEGLAYHTTYYTRVYTDLSPYPGEVRSFTTRSAESITYVYEPSDGATSVSVNPAITTTQVPGATSYTVQLSESPDFEVVDFEGSSADRRVLFSGLKYGTTYYNRVITDLSPTPGPVRSFATTSASSLAYVSTPGDGAIQVPLTVNIKANLVPGATSYTIQLSLTPDFTSIAFENTSANRVMPFSGLAYNTTYYNRVITDVSPEPGPVRSFTTATPDAVTYVLSPADGEADVDVPVRIISIIVADASSYTIQLSETPDFSVVAFEKSSTNRKIKFSDLLAGTTYFVRVKTDLSSEFGKVTSFTTRPTEGFAARMRDDDGSSARISSTDIPADNAIAFADRFEVDVYPNPFMERVSVIASDPETKALSVKVVDMAGKEMHKIDGVTNTRYEFGETLPAGAYVIILRTSTHMRVVRVMKRE